MKRKRLVVALALALNLGGSLYPADDAQAAGLGKLTVQSGLGQPLRAEIEVNSASPDEVATLQVRVASPDAFRQAGIEYNGDLASLKFAVERRGNRPVIRVSSSQPINEPFVDLLLELSWASGRLVREYTFLLDPPELRNSRVPETVAPAVSEIPAQVVPAPVPPRQPALAAPAVQAPATSAARPLPASNGAAPGDYTVRQGDTLGKIAGAVKPQGVSLDQMLVAMFRANPGAFSGNMNRLKSGAVLQVPQAGSAKEISDSEAHKEVVAQTADFSSYRARLADSVSAAPAGGERSAAGTVTPKVDDKAANKADSGDKVKLARPNENAAKTGATGGGSARSAEADQVAAKEKALQEAKQRVAELERNVSELNALVKNNAAASAQKSAEAAKAAALAKAAEEAKAAEAEKIAKAAEAAKAAAAAKAEELAKAAKAAEAAKKAKSEPTPAAESAKAESAKAETPKAETPKAGAPAPEPTKTAQPEVPAAGEAPTAQASWYEDPKVLGGGGILVALLAAFALFNRQRKRKFERFQDSILTGGDLKSNSIFGTTGGQSVDTSDSTFNSNFTPSASQLDSNEVDPIAEADVYIAYGRDAQAEEILKEALKTAPDRHAIRVKLLEIYAARRDVPAFETLAGELYSLTHGEGEDWEKAALLGRSLDPRNPLYGVSDDAAEAAADETSDLATPVPQPTVPLAATAPNPNLDPVSVDFDIGPTSEDPTPLDFDLGLTPSSPAVVDEEFRPAADSFGEMSNSENAASHVPSVDFDLNTEMNEPVSKADEILPISNTPTMIGLDETGLPLDVATVPSEELEQAEARARHVATLPPPELDLSDISLDLPGADVGTEVPAFDSAEASSKQQEMATKLDLAAAYHEIGDREGAQELLDEVIRGGDQDQQERARKMLEALA
jgi:pilus assembly protein FimV